MFDVQLFTFNQTFSIKSKGMMGKVMSVLLNKSLIYCQLQFFTQIFEKLFYMRRVGFKKIKNVQYEKIHKTKKEKYNIWWNVPSKRCIKMHF